MGLVGVISKLACHGDDLVALDAGNLFLPSGGVRRVVIKTEGAVFTGNATGHTVVGHGEVKHRGNQRRALLPGFAQLDATHRHLAHQDVVHRYALFIGAEVGRVNAAEIGEAHFTDFVVGSHTAGRRFHQTELEFDSGIVARFLVFQIPFANVSAAFCAPAKTDAAIGHHDLVALVDGQGLPLGVVGLAELAVEVTGAQVGAGHQHCATVGQLARFQLHQVGHVGIAAHVVIKVSTALVEVKLFQNYVAHSHGHGRIRALFGVHPQVGQLADLCIVGRDGYGLAAFVAHLGQEMGIGRARLWHVGAPGDDEVGVVPIG